MVKITLNIKRSYLLATLAVLLLGFTVAYGGNNPVVMGHSAGEMHVTVPGKGTKTLQAAIDEGDLAPKAKTSIISGIKKDFQPHPSRFYDFLDSSHFNLTGKGSGAFLVKVGPISDYWTKGALGTYDMSAVFLVTMPETTNSFESARIIPSTVSAHNFAGNGMVFRFLPRSGHKLGLIQAQIQTFTGRKIDIPYKIVSIDGFTIG